MAELRGCHFPEDLSYDPANHLWFAPEGTRIWRVGVTPFGVAIAGDILLFTPKAPGRLLAPGRAFGLLEAGKTVFPVKTPVAAELLEGNEALAHSARIMNQDPYGAWLARLRIAPEIAATALQPWLAARAAIEALMDLWRFEDLAAFQTPLLDDGSRSTP